MARYPLKSSHVQKRAHMDLGAYTPIPAAFHRHPALRRNGRPYYIAIHILAEVLNWYRPIWEEYLDEAGQVRLRAWQRFEGERLRLSYAHFADLLGISTEAVRRAVYFLRSQGLLVVESVHRQDEMGQMEGRILFAYPNWERVREILDPARYAAPEPEEVRDPIQRSGDTGRHESAREVPTENLGRTDRQKPTGETPAERHGRTGRRDSTGETAAERYDRTGRVTPPERYDGTSRQGEPAEETSAERYDRTGRDADLRAPTGIPSGTPSGTAVPHNQNSINQNQQPKSLKPKQQQTKANRALSAPGSKIAAAAHQDEKKLPQDILDALKAIGWRGTTHEVEQHWRKDPDRVRALLGYAKQKGWGGGLFRTALRTGEWPPDEEAVDPAAKYKADPFARFYE